MNAHETSHRPAQSAAAAAPHAVTRRAPKRWPPPRSPCTTWSTKGAPPTRRSKPRTNASIAPRCAPSRSARCAGICACRPALEPLVNRPFDELSPRLAALLVTAAHQVEYSRGAAEAQVHLAVDASRVIGEGRASGVVNAVLRRFVAQRAGVVSRRRRRPGAAACASALAGGCAASRPGASAAKRFSPPTTSIRRWCCASIPAQMHAEDFLRSWRALGREAPRRRMERRRRGARTARWPCRRCPASSRARCRCRMAARNSPRRCSTREPACACSTPARRRAARHCTSRSARPDLAELVAVDDDAAAPRPRARKSRARRLRCRAADRRPAHACRRRSRRTPSIACWWMRRVRPPA